MSRPPTVMMVSTNSDLAGAPLHVLTLIRSLRESYRFCCVFGEAGPVEEVLRAEGVEVHVLPNLRSAISPKADLASYSEMLRLARHIRPSIIHCHSSKAAMIGRLVASRLGLPAIFTVHGWGWRGDDILRRLTVTGIELALRWIARDCQYIFVADAVRDEGRRLLQVPSMRSHVIRNGVEDVEDMSAASVPSGSRRLIILMIARVSEAKDHETLVRAFDALNRDAELWLCGQGTDTPEFEDRCRSWCHDGGFDRIRRYGAISEVDQLIAQSDIVALTSHFEALPLSLLEAMRGGKPVVATAVGGVAEAVIDGETGFIVPRRDVAAVCAALTKLFDPSLRLDQGRAGRLRFVNEFHVDRMVAEVSQVYSAALGLTDPRHR